jgi:transposase
MRDAAQPTILTYDQLLTEKAALVDELQFVRRQLKEALEDRNHYAELVRLLRKKQYGASSEIYPSGQGTLFNEAEALAADSAKDAVEPDPEKKPKKRGKPKRRPLPKDLPRSRKVIDLPEQEKVCPKSGLPLKVIGEEVSEQLDIEPARLSVVETARLKYGCDCPACTTGLETPTLKTAPVEPQPLPKSMAAPGLLAYIVTGKYADALPLHRQEDIFRRHGIDLKRSTMSQWVIGLGALVRPLINLAKEELLSLPVIQGDETHYQILSGTGKAATSESYVWVFINGTRTGPKIILYEVGPSRSHTVPLAFLEGYEGYLQADGYEAYETFAAKRPKITLLGDWVHVRRKFDEAVKALPDDFKGESKAKVGLALINELFRIEREEIPADATDDERHRIRQELSRPLVAKIEAWMNATAPTVPPKTLTGVALSYMQGQWLKLLHFLDDPILRLDTNPVENAIRPFVIGRNNWLFSATIEGAESSAALYSLICMARANGRNVFEYLRAVFTELPKAKTVDEIGALLPWRWEPASKPAAR